MADVGWYVAPAVTRETVRKEGAVPWGDDVVGVHTTLEAALAYARRIVAGGDYEAGPDGTADVWEADISGLEQQEVAPSQDFPTLYVPPVPADRLQLVETL